MTRISDEHKYLINSYHCERLSSNDMHKELILKFENSKGHPLVSYFKTQAWDEDVESSTAYYVIKSSADGIALFFSLKCGVLFEPLNQYKIFTEAKLANGLLENIQKIKLQDLKNKWNQDIQMQVDFDYNISSKHLNRLVESAKEDKRRFNHLRKECEHEKNQQIVRVSRTYPAIELVHFCTNDLVKVQWEKSGIEHPLGEVMFWHYIAPIIYETQERIGCQYVFLFAADNSSDGVLVNYYNVALKFEQSSELGAAKPQYDFCCQFMCQEINNLKKHREAYFECFYPDVNDIIA